MADQTHPVSPPSNKRESMTTREEMDFEDNDHEQETGRVSPLGHDTLNTTNNMSVSLQERLNQTPGPTRTATWSTHPRAASTKGRDSPRARAAPKGD